MFLINFGKLDAFFEWKSLGPSRVVLS